MRAARGGHDEVARLLLAQGADVNARADDGWTALMIAAEGGHEEVEQLLRSHGAVE